MDRAKEVRNEEKRKRSAQIDGEIEAILAGEEELIPSSGFLASVMERVQQEASAPAPIPFPWKRAVPGILLAVGVFGGGMVELIQTGPPAVSLPEFALPKMPVGLADSFEQAGWVALALGVSLLCWLLSRRLAGRGGLL
jgi:hypothetical protein